MLIGAQTLALSSFESDGLPASSLTSASSASRNREAKAFQSRRISCAVSHSSTGGSPIGQHGYPSTLIGQSLCRRSRRGVFFRLSLTIEEPGPGGAGADPLVAAVERGGMEARGVSCVSPLTRMLDFVFM